MDVLSNKIVKTRKEHKCFGCNRLIEKGSKMDVSTIVNGGEIYTTRICKVCSSYVSKHLGWGDEYFYGELKSEDEDGWEEIRKEVEDKATTV